MERHEDSPNACWERGGYMIVRNGRNRKIFSPSGELIFDHGPAGYEDEIKFLEESGLLKHTSIHIGTPNNQVT